MPVNSKDKGKRGELQAAAKLREHGISARRGQQFSGSAESPDVITAIENVHIEVKRTERFRLYDALEQAETDSGRDSKPLVLHRPNRKAWVVVCYLDDLTDIATSWLAAAKQ